MLIIFDGDVGSSSGAALRLCPFRVGDLLLLCDHQSAVTSVKCAVLVVVMIGGETEMYQV